MTLNWRLKFKHHLQKHEDRIKHFRHYREMNWCFPKTTRFIYNQTPGIWAWAFENLQHGNWVMENCSDRWRHV